jgi:hypothetical protein
MSHAVKPPNYLAPLFFVVAAITTITTAKNSPDPTTETTLRFLAYAQIAAACLTLEDE